MSGAHDFGDAESLALDEDRLSFEDEPPVARNASRTMAAPAHQDLKFDDEPMDSPPAAQPKKDAKRIALLALIGGVVVVMLTKPLWQKVLNPPPVEDPAPTAMRPMDPVKPMVNTPPAQLTHQAAPASLGSASVAQPPSAAAPSQPPALLQPGANPGQAAASPSPLQPDAAADAAAEPALLAPSAKKTALSREPAAGGDADASQPKAAQAKEAAQPESLEAKVARLEKEVKTLRERNRQMASRGAGQARAPKAHGDGGKDAGSKVLGMSSTSVWVKKSNGGTAELRVGDHFRNGEVIQSIDQQAQVVETDRGRYKVSF
ncbi:hypothetical protein KIF53_17510 [Chromobacterium subtsugae]|uniref:Uncharacterized protein n=3 Tax=Chromobacterium subtsugae TaxID=251747 RepID=A0ABS7FIX8_9NEIS|nr:MULTISPECIES: hypothetical protein [Chromobacterium]MBW7568735.1 hypothetical protein [Chromobacterium subtsugae]MBW8289435.1 hypothetical protein [Chromobacterium subtsugae]WSE90023.1 hypothetical protein U6115_14120 [Chromobacterium subtsugae]WVH58394.1 hypothetical protein U6151_14140 [Chromobacterium subtsugae]